MNIIVKIGIISLVFIICSLLLKSYRPEFVFLLRIFCGAIILSLIADHIGSFISELLVIFSSFRIDSVHISLLFKVIAITVVADLISDSLNDVGESSIANIIVIISKFIVLFMTMPLINSLIIFCLKFVE